MASYEVYQHRFSLKTKTASKCADKILDLLRTNPKKLNKYAKQYYGESYDDPQRDGVEFPFHMLVDDYLGVTIDPSDNFYAYAPKYSKDWMNEIGRDLETAMQIYDEFEYE